ncbi:hypothetical protein HPP92_019683 [Vanilla planifolia]|uniref:Uncharacterized protein n=1 Tax=Vanilla planifolia TaxID=51239 RepID=A0A835ULR4_VANPL|nr:hypothetical protein HPP92_020105 [Vanilla planifolia]KAG0465519.1 hypothetical protein HPP92_019683 [Vanilla planifolia]
MARAGYAMISLMEDASPERRVRKTSHGFVVEPGSCEVAHWMRSRHAHRGLLVPFGA